MNRAEHDQYAEEYDYLVREYEYHTSDIIFGLLFEYTDPGDKLLDLGIGTGISSFLFHKAGLNIYGLDNSDKMLDICRKKNIACDLKLFDLKQGTLPYADHIFDHVIAVGLLHFFEDLEKFFAESNRILKERGTLSFTVKDSKTGISREVDKEYNIAVYGHSDEYIEKLIQKYNFKLRKRLRFLTWKDLSKQDFLCFKAYVLSRI